MLVERPASLGPFLALLDTGCSLALLMDSATAHELGVVEAVKVRRNQLPERVRMADGTSADLKPGRLSLIWNGVTRSVAVEITMQGQIFPEDGSWPGTEPKALLGCQLMAGNKVTINFCARTIELTDCTNQQASVP